MDCNQQRRPRGSYGRPMMNGGQAPMQRNAMGNRASGANCGCGGNTRSNTAGMDSFGVGMAYVPWQRWNQTYDMHRGLMSGTIFPELDKPFCAAGRCGR